MGTKWVQVVALSLGRWWCPLEAGDRGFEGSGPAGRLALVLCRVFRCFCPLSRFALGALLANMPLFRVLRAFLARFGVVVWVCLAWVLCVACGAFVRVNS